jgi:hydrogenase expression/formation protein HypD
VQIQYKRAVRPEGNLLAQALLREVFVPSDGLWRGLGNIPGSGYALAPRFRKFDAARKFDLKVPKARENPACRCGEVLRGIRTPAQCALFASACTPETPFGPCMVSTEGTCAAWYKYGRK